MKHPFFWNGKIILIRILYGFNKLKSGLEIFFFDNTHTHTQNVYLLFTTVKNVTVSFLGTPYFLQVVAIIYSVPTICMFLLYVKNRTFISSDQPNLPQHPFCLACFLSYPYSITLHSLPRILRLSVTHCWYILYCCIHVYIVNSLNLSKIYSVYHPSYNVL